MADVKEMIDTADQEMSRKLTVEEQKARAEKLFPVMVKILDYVVDQVKTKKFTVGVPEESQVKELTLSVLEMLLAEDISFEDRHAIFMLLLQPFATIQEKVFHSLDITWELYVAKLVGKPYNELKMTDIQKVLMESKS